MIKGAIFDADGTLLDSLRIWRDAGIRYLRSLGIEGRPGLSEALWELSISEGAEYLKKSYSLTLSTKDIKNGIVSIVRDFYHNEVSLIPGVFSVLRTMKIPKVIATSCDRDCLEAALKKTGIEGFFEGIFTCDEVGEGKKSPKIYLRAAEFLGFEPSEICVFEDELYAAQTAKGAGFLVMLI